MIIKQLSVFAENRPGSVCEITKVIADANVDIRALCVADTQDFGILRLIVSDIEKAKAALSDAGCITSVTEVIAVAIPDTPGGLSFVLQTLSDAGINIEYVYAFITVSRKKACVVLRVGDNGKAAEILNAAGIDTLSENDVHAF